MASWFRSILRKLRGERRHAYRQNAEKVQVVNRQYKVASKLARRMGVTPDELMDYHRADRILGRRHD